LDVYLTFVYVYFFCRVKSLRQTFYGIFILALSIIDIFKLMTEYVVHILYFYIEHPYFVCALGIERNLKVWIVDHRRCSLIIRRRAILIACLLIFSVFIHDHFFLFPPYNIIYCYLDIYNRPILFSCDNAFYRSYRSTYSLADLILPVGTVLINILLIFGLKRRSHKRRRCLSVLR